MTEPTIAAARQWWRGRSGPDFVAHEIVGPLGIADLVGVRFDPKGLKGRRDAGIRPTDDLLALRVILACRRAARSTGDLASLLGFSDSGIRRAVQVAYETGALNPEGGRRHRTHPAWRPAAGRLVAVELKRSDWRRAANQVWAYMCWANAAWVVLGQRPPRSAADGLSDSGVGLAYLDEEGELRIVLRAKTSRRVGTEAGVWAAEQALMRALAAGRDPSVELRSGFARPAGAQAVPAG
jgi:hypothetical protein